MTMKTLQTKPLLFQSLLFPDEFELFSLVQEQKRRLQRSLGSHMGQTYRIWHSRP